MDKVIRVNQLNGAGDASGHVLVGEKLEPIEVIRLAIDKNASQVVQEASPYFQAELKSASIMIDAPGDFFKFPLAMVLSPDNLSEAEEDRLKVIEIEVNDSDEKGPLMDRIQEAIQNYARPRSLLDDIFLVADELITNAMYNAPCGQTGRKIDRSDRVVLPPHLRAKVKLGVSGDRMVLVCEDMYGSLNIEAFLARIAKCYEEGLTNTMNFGRGGAGIGSYLIFHSCKSIYIGVKPGEKTIFACVFSMGKGCRARQELSKSVHTETKIGE